MSARAQAANIHPAAAPMSAPRAVASPAPTMTLAHVAALDEDERTARIDVGGATVVASLDPALSATVVRTAMARGERVVIAEEGGEWSVVGALRVSPTPGVDEGDEFVIKAKRVLVSAEHEFAVVAGVASWVLRAHGAVETVARDITSRAANLHKIVGRLIRLN